MIQSRPTDAPAGTTPSRVLVIDDEPAITDLLGTALRYMGFEVRTAGTGMAGLEAARDNAPDLVVLDVMLPDIDGFEVCRRLRESGDFVPVIFLTARDAEDDRVTGFIRGGDDYVTKPFSLEELTLRIGALLRRTKAGGEQDARLQYRDLEMDEDRHQVWRAGRTIELSPTEFRLLRYLLLNPERVLSKQQILDHVWQYDFNGEDNVVETYISYLRRKVDKVEPRLDPDRARLRLRAPRRHAEPVAPVALTLRTRLVLSLGVVLVLALVVMATLIVRTTRSNLIDQIDTQLETTDVRDLARPGGPHGPDVTRQSPGPRVLRRRRQGPGQHRIGLRPRSRSPARDPHGRDHRLAVAVRQGGRRPVGRRQRPLPDAGPASGGAPEQLRVQRRHGRAHDERRRVGRVARPESAARRWGGARVARSRPAGS